MCFSQIQNDITDAGRGIDDSQLLQRFAHGCAARSIGQQLLRRAEQQLAVTVVLMQYDGRAVLLEDAGVFLLMIVRYIRRRDDDARRARCGGL